MKGRIIKSTGSWYDILDQSGEIYKGRLKGKFKIKGLKVTNPLAVGDFVQFTPEENSDSVVIEEILPRHNYIMRKSIQKKGFGHILGANIDQAVIICTLKSPKTSLGFIDRFLVIAESFRIPTTIIFNKIDLLDENDEIELEETKQIYEPIGYDVKTISIQENTNTSTLAELFSNKVTLLAGHSGVGKSSLINLLAPSLSLRTSEISTAHNKGKHTTTFTEMLQIDQESFIIDSPGIQELGLIELEKNHISHYFPEMRSYLGQCKYHNCIHLKEPGCAIKEAVENDKIPASRYFHYMGLINEDDFKKI